MRDCWSSIWHFKGEMSHPVVPALYGMTDYYDSPQPNNQLSRYLDALASRFITNCGIRQRDPRRIAHFKMF